MQMQYLVKLCVGIKQTLPTKAQENKQLRKFAEAKMNICIK